MQTVAEMWAADADPSGQKTIDALLEAERHLEGVTVLLGDLRGTHLDETGAALLEQVWIAARSAERKVLLARGFLTHPGGALNAVIPSLAAATFPG
jgi:hypothetical protein